jgi:DNA-binding PadR family transcriptional regulator
VAEWVQEATQEVLLLEEGTLYPALHRLERRGWVSSEWGVSENNRRAKFYAITAAGRAQLRGETPAWLRHADAIAQALRAPSPEAA